MRAPAEKSARGENSALLRTIGTLIRNERAKRGMTRRALAEQCQTSERYLAQIESGIGNPSVLVLDSIARALDVDPVDLMPAPRRRHKVHRIDIERTGDRIEHQHAGIAGP